MARIYQSRALIDPSLYQLSGQLMNERIRQEHERRKMLSDAITAAGEGLGKTINSGIEEYKTRQDEAARKEYIDQVMADNEEFAKYQNNPFFKAGVNEFIRTGASSPLMSFLSSERAAQEHSDTKKWHDAVRAEQARERYAKNLELYDKADTEAQKQQYLLANQALEKEFGNIFGQQMSDYAVAKNQDDIEARRLAYELAEDKKEAEAKARRSDDTKYWIQQNIMPVGSVKPEKAKGKVVKSAEEVRGEIADFINRNPDLDDGDKKELLDKLFGNKTQTELNQSAADSANASFTGEKTGQALKDADNKKKAKTYVGQKLNSLQWNKVPEEQRKFLTRDASGKVSWRK